MIQRVMAEKSDTSGAQYDYGPTPDLCPLCHSGVSPRRIIAAITEDTFGGVLQIVYRCPRHDCDRLFIAYYTKHNAYGAPRSDTYFLNNLAPVNFVEESFGEQITQTSPKFIEIYNQAAAAEVSKLNQVAGMGYRKALEFLIKDYLITRMPGDADSIKTTMLGNCINNFVDDSRIKSVAVRATWLGNDETHYVRKFEDHDIEDMRRLIKLTVIWIESVLITEEYEARMTKQGAAKK